MNAMVLAAGKGTRLGSLTQSFPKPMIPLNGKPILGHVLRLLKRHGVHKVVINLHHFPQPIIKYVGNGRKWNLEVVYSREKKLMGTAGGVKKAERHFPGTFLVYYGDNFSTYRISSLVKFHRRHKGVATIGLFKGQEANPSLSGLVVLNGEGRVKEFLEKPDPRKAAKKKGWVNAGIYVFEPEIFRFIPKGKVRDFGRDIFPKLLKANQKVYGYVTRSYVRGIDTPGRLQQVKKELRVKS